MKPPWPHQPLAIRMVRNAIASGAKRIVLCMPTGSGKTWVSASIIQLVLARQKNVLFLADRRTLIGQKSDTLNEFGVKHSILMAGKQYGISRVTVASRDTFLSRVVKSQRVIMPDPDLIIWDEYHNSMGKASEQIKNLYSCPILGLTATPGRANGLGLGPGHTILRPTSYDELIAGGQLVPVKVFGPAPPDLRGVDISRSSKDYKIDQLSQKMSTSVLVGDAVQQWIKHGQGRPTVVFTCDIRHSKYVTASFNAAGYPWAHIDQGTSDDERKRIFKDLAAGALCGVSNCAVLTTGWDLPGISCGILLRPTTSVVLFVQMVGRILRAALGKQDAILLDHAGAVLRHGWPTLDREWPESGLIVDSGIPQAKKESVRHCPQCAAIWDKGNCCPHCGWHYTPRARASDRVVDGELSELKRRDVGMRAEQSDEQKGWLESLARAAWSGKTFQQAMMIFHRRFGKFPQALGLKPMVQPGQRKQLVRDLFPGFTNRRKRAAP